MLTSEQLQQLRELYIKCADMKASSFTALVLSEYPDITVKELGRAFHAYKLWTDDEEDYLKGLYSNIDSFEEVVTAFNYKYTRSYNSLIARVSKLAVEGKVVLKQQPTIIQEKPVINSKKTSFKKEPNSKPIMDGIYDC